LWNIIGNNCKTRTGPDRQRAAGSERCDLFFTTPNFTISILCRPCAHSCSELCNVLITCYKIDVSLRFSRICRTTTPGFASDFEFVVGIQLVVQHCAIVYQICLQLIETSGIWTLFSISGHADALIFSWS